MTLPYFTWPLGGATDPEPPSAPYVVRVQLHDIATWVVSNDPDFDPVFLPEDPIGLLADPLTITRTLPQSDLWPLQPDPATATFAVVTPTAADLDAVAIGSTVAITYHSPYVAFVAPTEAFYGRVADVKATPGHYVVGTDEEGGPLIYGAMHTITCVDYLADQADDQIRWGIPYYDLLVPTTPIPYLLADFFDQAGMGDLVFEEYDGESEPDSPWVQVPEQDAETGALTLIENLLAQWPLNGDTRGPARYVLDQNIDAATGLPDADQPYLMRLAFKNRDPATDDYTDAPDPTHVTVVDAAHTDLAATTYSLRKYDGIRKVIVYPAPGYGVDRAVEELTGTPKPAVKIATAIDTQVWVDALAVFYLPDDVARNRYAADTFRWFLHAAPEGSFLPELGELVAVDGIDAAWTPSGLTWFTGRLTGYTLTIANKRPTLDFTLRDVAS